MTIGAGNSRGIVETSVDRASMPPADEPTTTNWSKVSSAIPLLPGPSDVGRAPPGSKSYTDEEESATDFRRALAGFPRSRMVGARERQIDMAEHDIVVVGASAGGVEALRQLTGSL